MTLGQDVAYEQIVDNHGLRRWEVAVTASDGELRQMSFVNSIWTIRGGKASPLLDFAQSQSPILSLGSPLDRHACQHDCRQDCKAYDADVDEKEQRR